VPFPRTPWVTVARADATPARAEYIVQMDKGYGTPSDADMALRRVDLLRSDIGSPALRAV
jgi:hypothetical protein